MDSKNIAKEIAEVAKGYDYQQPPGLLVKLQELITNILRALQDLLNLLQFPQTGSSDTKLVGNLLQTLLIIVAVIAAVVVSIVLARRFKHLDRQRKLAMGELLVGETALDSKGWRRLAVERKQHGATKEACRALYMSCLHLLDEDGIAVFAPTKTNYEYFYALKKAPLIAQNFRPLVDSVELIWFGNKEAEDADYDNCLSYLNEIEKASAQAKALKDKAAEAST